MAGELTIQEAHEATGVAVNEVRDLVEKAAGALWEKSRGDA